MTDTAINAAQALADVRASQARLAAQSAQCPPWRHAAFGAIIAAMIGTMTISSQVQIFAMPLIMAGLALIVRDDRKRYGVFVNGYRKGKTLPVTLLFLCIMVAVVMAALHLRDGFTLASKAALTALAFALAVLFSVVWNRVYRAELTGGEA